MQRHAARYSASTDSRSCSMPTSVPIAAFLIGLVRRQGRGLGGADLHDGEQIGQRLHVGFDGVVRLSFPFLPPACAGRD